MRTEMKRRAFLQSLGILWAGWTVEGWAKPLRTDRYSASLVQVSETRNLMGTFVTITLFHSSPERGQAVLGEAFQRMENQIGIFNRHDNRSPLSYLNERGVLSNPPPELVKLLQRSLTIHLRTGGVFDPTVKPVLDLYETEKERGRLPQPAAIRATLDRVGAGGLKTGFQEIVFSKEGMGVTLDGIAKGAIVDDAIVFLQKKGIRRALVDAGGDLRVMGGRSDDLPWRIAVYHPDQVAQDQEIITLMEGAVATSGNYMVFFDREKVHHHILQPKNGDSPPWSVSATVLAPSAEEADALATSLMLLNSEEGLALINRDQRLAARLISREGRSRYSLRWTKNFRTREGGKEDV
ncbi:MAG: FAD:protein FMN transferase [Deltaproteobacteria bacterium]|nr:FAD:protein FMN transferase [Deltaproteobacteria bacterium]